MSDSWQCLMFPAFILADVKGKEGLLYTAKPKQELKFVPLNSRSKPMSAAKFLQNLQKEANNQRKQQKSNSLSGLYK